MSDKNYECKDQMVSHPSHYQSESGLEVIDVIEAFTADLTGIEAVDTANVIKYICRWKNKNGVQDLNKAMWYLQHLINHEEDNSDSDENMLLVPNEYGKYCVRYVFPTSTSLKDFKISIETILDTYGFVTLVDCNDLMNRCSRGIVVNWGWASLKGMRIVDEDGKHFLILPPPKKLY